MTKARPKKKQKIRLDLGPGPKTLVGFIPIDINMADGADAFDTLQYPDGSVHEIHSSHLIEHCSHPKVDKVLRDWVRVLRPGGRMRLATVDFAKLAEMYCKGKPAPYEAYVMGAHIGPYDCHGSIWNERKLRVAMRHAGLIDITRWKGHEGSCAEYDFSLNLEGYKMRDDVAIACAKPAKVAAVISVPRLGFNDHWGCCWDALKPLGISMHRVIGAFWGQCLEQAWDEVLKTNPDFIMCLDYDTVFKKADAEELIYQMRTHTEIDALAPMHAGRGYELPLFTVRGKGRKGKDGKNISRLSSDKFADDLLPGLGSAHFGMTVLRASSLRSCPPPWLVGTPNKDGRWAEGKTDPDIAFWMNWTKAGKTIYLANRVVLGHLELMVKWPGKDLHVIHQDVREWNLNGKPKEAWS